MHNKAGSPVAFVEYSVIYSTRSEAFLFKLFLPSPHSFSSLVRRSRRRASSSTQDVRLATHAMNALQGYVLFSSDRGGMRIEYAKNKMGEVSTQIIPVSAAPTPPPQSQQQPQSSIAHLIN